MKTIDTLPLLGWEYPLESVNGLPSLARVDKERRIIFGAALIQLGDVNDDRPWYADEITLQQTLSLAKSHLKGLKARATHPNVSNDGLGKFLGRWKNHRLSDDGTTVLSDIHMASLAFKGAHGGYGQFILDSAIEDPGSLGVSLAPRYDMDEMERLQRPDGKMPLRFLSFTAADLVDEAAATRGGLFGGAPLSIVTAPAQATAALNSLFADASADVVRQRVSGFLDKYLSTRFGCSGSQGEEKMAEAHTLTRDDVQAIVKESLSASLGTLKTELLALLPAKVEPDKETGLSQTDILAERTRCKELQALAKNAGLANWEKAADGWIDKGLSVIEAKAAIGDLAIAQNGLSNDAGDGNDDTDAKYRKEYQQNLSSYAAMGLSQEEYITSRKIEDGKELLAPAKSA